jgi:hypothetical protein
VKGQNSVSAIVKNDLKLKWIVRDQGKYTSSYALICLLFGLIGSYNSRAFLKRKYQVIISINYLVRLESRLHQV